MSTDSPIKLPLWSATHPGRLSTRFLKRSFYVAFGLPPNIHDGETGPG